MKISTQILLAFSFVIMLSAADTVSNYLLSLKVEQNIKFLSSSQDIMRNSTRLHKTIIEMQNSFRGYLLTADIDYRENYDNGLKTYRTLLTEQRRVVNDKKQLSILDNIEQTHSQWVRYADSLINVKEKTTITIPPASDGKIGKTLTEEIRKNFLDFDKTEYRSRKIHSNNLIASIDKTHTFSFTLLILTIIIGTLSTIYIVILISKRINKMVNQAVDISKGNFAIVYDTRKDELTKLSDSLNTMSQILRKNINELENRNTELDKFAYVVSHDLKAPLRGIHNVVKWIEEDLGSELSDELKHYLSIIPQRTQRMEDLINGLLDYARIRKTSVPEPTDVRQIINEIKDTIVPDNFTIETHNLPTIVTERLKLEQVFTNLISNAVKYTQRDNAKIAITCSKKQSHYEFSVKDNGVGIAPEFHEKIFEIFQTLRDKNEKESTGIGLAIVKKIIEEQHCAIKLISTSGNGAEFIFTWPRNTI